MWFACGRLRIGGSETADSEYTASAPLARHFTAVRGFTRGPASHPLRLLPELGDGADRLLAVDRVDAVSQHVGAAGQERGGAGLKVEEVPCRLGALSPERERRSLSSQVALRTVQPWEEHGQVGEQHDSIFLGDLGLPATPGRHHPRSTPSTSAISPGGIPS